MSEWEYDYDNQGPDFEEIDFSNTSFRIRPFFGMNPTRCSITSDYCKGNNPCRECIINIKHKEELKMARENIGTQLVIGAPKFAPQQVIDISYKHGGLPNRIKIEQVHLTDVSVGYIYDVLLESTGETTNMTQVFIDERACHKGAPVYSVEAVAKRYERGWRFCGNFYTNKVEAEAKKIAKSKLVAHVRLTEAYFPDGNLVPNQNAIWIQYDQSIADNGNKLEYISPKYFTRDIK